MKHIFTVTIYLLCGIVAYGQKDSIRGRQFQLTGRMQAKMQVTPECGIFAWGTVVQFEVLDLVGMSYSKKNIGIIITCPGFYKKNFFEKGKKYQVVFSDQNQANFGWVVPNKEILKKNSLLFEPYAISVKRL